MLFVCLSITLFHSNWTVSSMLLLRLVQFVFCYLKYFSYRSKVIFDLVFDLLNIGHLFFKIETSSLIVSLNLSLVLILFNMDFIFGPSLQRDINHNLCDCVSMFCSKHVPANFFSTLLRVKFYSRSFFLVLNVSKPEFSVFHVVQRELKLRGDVPKLRGPFRPAGHEVPDPAPQLVDVPQQGHAPENRGRSPGNGPTTRLKQDLEKRNKL